MRLYLKTLIPDYKGNKTNCGSIEMQEKCWLIHGIKQEQMSGFVLQSGVGAQLTERGLPAWWGWEHVMGTWALERGSANIWSPQMETRVGEELSLDVFWYLNIWGYGLVLVGSTCRPLCKKLLYWATKQKLSVYSWHVSVRLYLILLFWKYFNAWIYSCVGHFKFASLQFYF